MKSDKNNKDNLSALLIVAIYGVLCTIWSFFSDDLALYLGWNATGVIPDSIFIAVTSVILYCLLISCLNKHSLMEEKHRRNSARLELALAASKIGVWEWNLQTNVVLWSPECHDIVGLKDFNGTFEKFAELLHPDDAVRVMENVERVLAQKSDYTDEFRIIRPDGKLCWLFNLGQAVYDSNGIPVQLIGTVRDITERKMVEKSLCESEERYRAVVQDQTETITRYLPDGTYTFVNEVYCRMFGKTDAELLGHSWHPDAFPDDLALVKEKLQKMSPEHPVVVVENRVRSASGEVLWMQFVNRGFYGQDGQLIETQAVGRDITELKSAEAKIDRYMREVHDLYYNAPCGYHSLDADGIYVRINDTELDWLGYDRIEVIGKKCFADLIAAECRAAFRSNFARFKEHGSIEGLEYVMIRKDGTRLSVLLSATIVKDSQGNYLMSRGVLLDITERKKAEETMRRYAHRLLEMDEDLRKKLAADLHDEIGRDLTALGLNIAMVHDYLPAEIREQVAVRLDDSRAMLEAMSRSVRGLMSKLRPPVLDDYGLPAALRWHCDLFSKRSGLDIELSVVDDFPRLTNDRELALFRIAQESLTNISKHAKAHIVKVTLIEVSTMIRLSICDDGVGFDTSQAFQRQEGSCWGLTVMRERAEAANGAFYLDSAPGNGTCIMVELNRSE